MKNNHDIAQICLGNLGEIEKAVNKIENKLKEIEKQIEYFKKNEILETKSYIETQKTLFQYFIKED